MRVVENSAERLVLRGVPGGTVWMVFCLLLGLAVMAAAVGFASATYDGASGALNLQLIPLGIGVLMGLAFFLIGAVTLAVGRVELTLDRVTGEGIYEVCSPIVEAGKPCRFRLEHIARLELKATEEARPPDADGEQFDAQVVRLRLLVTRPRRTIVLDETQNGRVQRVQRTAEAVAAWLGVDPPPLEEG